MAINRDQIEVNYEVLDQVAQIFSNQCDTTRAMYQALNQQIESLRTDGWIGRGSDAFFSEMSGEVLPMLKRMIDSLEQGSQSVKQLSNLMQQAEEDAQNVFNA